jgi:hypothetical protein
MNDEIADILKGYLSFQDKTHEGLLHEVLEMCKSVKGTEEAIVRLESMVDNYSSGLELLDKVPYCHLFLSYAQYRWNNSAHSTKCALDAIQGFEQRHEIRNLALAFWIRALVYWESAHVDEAKQDINKAIELIKQEMGDNKRTSHYEKCQDCEIILERIISDAHQMGMNIPSNRKSQNTYEPSPQPSQSSRPLKPSNQLIFPAYDPVNAGLEGNFIFDSEPALDGVVEEINFRGIPHLIYNEREQGAPIRLHPFVYRWLQVKGNSMDQAEPVPICNNDFVLVVDVHASDIKPQYNDIVVAAVRNPTPEERAGVIKKYTRNGLRSMSSQPYDVFPLQNVSIRGVVIAVAKPVH